VTGYRSDGALCVVLLRYVRPLEEVDAHMAAHVEWLETGLREGAFLVAGRRAPRTGGVIVVRGTADEVRTIAATDPFVTSGVADAEVIAFNASFAQPALTEWLA
jgi:uncharacterized protein YciI